MTFWNEIHFSSQISFIFQREHNISITKRERIGFSGVKFTIIFHIWNASKIVRKNEFPAKSRFKISTFCVLEQRGSLPPPPSSHWLRRAGGGDGPANGRAGLITAHQRQDLLWRPNQIINYSTFERFLNNLL